MSQAQRTALGTRSALCTRSALALGRGKRWNLCGAGSLHNQVRGAVSDPGERTQPWRRGAQGDTTRRAVTLLRNLRGRSLSRKPLTCLPRRVLA